MATHRFRILNVFTHRGGVLTGNPLCVFEDGRDFDTPTMQALACQFNLSETTFIRPSSRADAAVRIFTPNYEMPFAGHPTLGTAHVCRALGKGGDALTLEMPAGLIPVVGRANRWTLTALTPTWREVDTPRDVIARALGLGPEDIGERPLWVKAGKEQLIVPLRSEAAVRRAVPNPGAFASIRSEDEIAMAYVFAWRVPAEADAALARGTPHPYGPRRTLARFFFPATGGAMLEDPATGSATANFGGWCLAMGWPLPLSVEIEQGECVARPSTLYLEVDAQRAIRVSGEVLEIGSGHLTL